MIWHKKGWKNAKSNPVQAGTKNEAIIKIFFVSDIRSPLGCEPNLTSSVSHTELSEFARELYFSVPRIKHCFSRSLYPHNVNTNPCTAATPTVISVSNCIKQEAKRVGRKEFQSQVDNALTSRARAKLENQRNKRITNLEKHVNNYMARTMNTISRCGQGLSVDVPATLVTMVNNPPSDNADGWFKIWNTFVTHVLTGETVTCAWYDSSMGKEGIDQSSFPCRTRRVFVKMQGRTQNGQVFDCRPGDFDTYDL